jgi:hypothetical protein
MRAARGIVGWAEEVFESRDEGMDEGGDALRGFAGDGAVEDVVGEENGFRVVAELGEQAVGALASRLGEEDGAQAQAAADGLFDQLDALDGDRAIVVGSGLGKGFAKILDEGILAAGDEPEAFVRRMGVSLGHVPPVDLAASQRVRAKSIVECWSARWEMIICRLMKVLS